VCVRRRLCPALFNEYCHLIAELATPFTEIYTYVVREGFIKPDLIGCERPSSDLSAGVSKAVQKMEYDWKRTCS
jgi:hypothetical protein